MDEYTEKFHNLGGRTLGEHYRNFNHLVQQLDDLKNERLATILNQIAPKHHQEDLFYIQLLARYERKEKLQQILYEGRVILCKFLVKEAFDLLFGDLQPDTFINEVCPNLSYVTRVNVVHKLSKRLSGERAEAFFDCVRRKYGLKLATPLLIRCREDFVAAILNEHKLEFTTNEWIDLSRQHPDVFISVFEKLKTPLVPYKKLFHDVAMHNLDLFYKLHEVTGYRCSPGIGKNLFVEFVKRFKSEIISNPIKFDYLLVFKDKIVYKALSNQEFYQFYKNNLPDKIENFKLYGQPVMLLTYLPLKRRVEFVKRAYIDKYGWKLDLSDLPKEYQFWIPLTDLLILKYEHPQVKFENLKLRISLTADMFTRKHLLFEMLGVCLVDHTLLLDVLKYFCKHHNNEGYKVRVEFLQDLVARFQIQKLSNKHWWSIKKIMRVFYVNGEDIDCRIPIYEKAVQYHVLNRHSYQKELKMFLKTRNSIWNEFNVMLNSPYYERLLLLQYPELLAELKDVIKYNHNQAFIKALIKHNEKHQKNKYNRKYCISYYDYPEILTALLESLKSNDEMNKDYVLNELLRKIFRYKHKNKSKFSLQIATACLNLKQNTRINNTFRKILFKYILRNNPEFVLENLEQIASRNYLNDCFYDVIRMHFTEIPLKLKAIYLNLLNIKNPQITTALAFLAYDNDYLKLISELVIQDQDTIDLYDRNMRLKLKTQKGFLNSVRNCLNPLNEIIPYALPYYNSDYLCIALKTLHYTLYNTPVNLLEPYFNILMERAPSVRKQAIYLHTVLYDTNAAIEFLHKARESELYPGVKKIIFMTYFNYCLENSMLSLNDSLPKFLKLLTKDDVECTNYLLDFQRVPKQLLPGYIKIIWDHLKSYEKVGYQALAAITPAIMAKLSHDFADTLLTHTFDEGNQYSSQYVFAYLIAANSKLNNRFNSLAQLIERLDSSNYQNALKISSKLYFLFRDLMRQLIEHSKSKKPEAKTLCQYIVDNVEIIKVPLNKFLVESTMVYTNFYLSIEGSFNVKLASFIIEHQRATFKKYHSGINSYYSEFVKQFFWTVYGIVNEDKENILYVIQEMLHQENTTDVKLLAIQMLGVKVDEKSLLYGKYTNVLEEIRKECDEVVEIKLAQHLLPFFVVY